MAWFLWQKADKTANSAFQFEVINLKYTYTDLQYLKKFYSYINFEYQL